MLCSTNKVIQNTHKRLVKSQLIRFRRICTYLCDVEEVTLILFKALRPRGYSRRFPREIKQEVRQIFETNGKYVVEKDNKGVIPVVTTYSQPLGRLGGQLRFHFQQAQGDLGLLSLSLCTGEIKTSTIDWYTQT